MKVGIVGASFARAAYLPALRHVPDAQVVAIASGRIDSARSAAEAFGVPHAYDDWQAMLDAHALDAVLVATPTDLHAPITLAALERGAHVVCEKPTAMSVAQAQAMLDKAEALGRRHMIDHELRFNPNRMRVAELIAGGGLGEIRHVNIANIGASWANPASRPRGDWWSLAEHGGGRLGANGSHQVDMLRWWLGEAASVSGLVRTMVPDRLDKTTGEPWTATADDVAQIDLQFRAGALAHVFMSGVSVTNLGNLTQVFGSKATLTLANEDEKLYRTLAGQSPEDISVADPNAALDGLNAGIWNVSVVAALREFFAAIAQNRPLRQGASFLDGLRNQQILDAVIQSSAERRWIDINPLEASHAAAA